MELFLPLLSIVISGAFACVYAEFHFDRKFEYYLLQTYFPSMLVVMLSWVSFWIDPAAVPARISLGLLTVLTMTTQTSVLNSRLPRFIYTRFTSFFLGSSSGVLFLVFFLFLFSLVVDLSILGPSHRNQESIGDQSRGCLGIERWPQPFQTATYHCVYVSVQLLLTKTFLFWYWKFQAPLRAYMGSSTSAGSLSTTSCRYTSRPFS